MMLIYANLCCVSFCPCIKSDLTIRHPCCCNDCFILSFILKLSLYLYSISENETSIIHCTYRLRIRTLHFNVGRRGCEPFLKKVPKHTQFSQQLVYKACLKTWLPYSSRNAIKSSTSPGYRQHVLKMYNHVSTTFLSSKTGVYFFDIFLL